MMTTLRQTIEEWLAAFRNCDLAIRGDSIARAVIRELEWMLGEIDRITEAERRLPTIDSTGLYDDPSGPDGP